MKRVFSAFVMSTIIIFTATSCGTTSSSGGSNPQSAQVESETVSNWAPAGFTQVDGNVAWRWATEKEQEGVYGNDECFDKCSYVAMVVTSNEGCTSGIYVAVNFLNDAGMVEDWTNDTVPALGSGQEAILLFTSYKSTGSGQVQMAEINCY
jgi:hypothetical protein